MQRARTMRAHTHGHACASRVFHRNRTCPGLVGAASLKPVGGIHTDSDWYICAAREYFSSSVDPPAHFFLLFVRPSDARVSRRVARHESRSNALVNVGRRQGRNGSDDGDSMAASFKREEWFLERFPFCLRACRGLFDCFARLFRGSRFIFRCQCYSGIVKPRPKENTFQLEIVVKLSRGWYNLKSLSKRQIPFVCRFVEVCSIASLGY